MPVDGFPDNKVHRLCMRCRKWHYPHEGIMKYPEPTGPISAMHSAFDSLSDNHSAIRFICYRCLRVRRYTKAIIFGTFILIVAGVLVLERIGVL